MNLSNLRARVCRLDELARGLAKEVVIWKAGNDPLLYRERKTYLKAIQDALSGVEEARAILAKARQRLETEQELKQARQRRGDASGLEWR